MKEGNCPPVSDLATTHLVPTTRPYKQAVHNGSLGILHFNLKELCLRGAVASFNPSPLRVII